MKKIYALFSIFFLTITTFAQGSESFTNMPSSSSSYATRTWVGDGGVSWTAGNSRTDGPSASSAITGMNSRFIIMSNNTGILSTTISNGVGTLSFLYAKAFTSASNIPTFGVFINGVQQGVTITASSNAAQTASFSPNISGTVTLEIKQLTANASGRLGLDDIAWTSYSSGADITPPTITTLTPLDNATNVPINTNLQILFSEPIAKGIGNILIKKVSDNSIIQTIDVTTAAVNIVGSTATISINSLLATTDYYVEIAAGVFTDIALNNFAGIAGNTTWNFTTIASAPAAGIINNNYAFTNCATTFLTEGWSQYSVTGTQVWGCTTPGRAAAPDNGVQMNAFVSTGNNPLNEDWLFSPLFDLSAASLPTLKFYSKGDFVGNSLQLKISNNYTAGTNPTTATWTNLTGNFPANVAAQGAWTLSDNIDLSAFNTPNVTIAWVYINPTVANSSRWTIDDVTVYSNVPPPVCISPVAQPTLLTFGTITDVSIAGSFTATSPAVDDYLVIMSANPTLATNPTDGQTYIVGDNIGGDAVVVGVGNSLNFTSTGLSALTTYYFFVLSYNNVGCSGGPIYNTAAPLTDNATTIAGLPICTAPVSQPTNLTFSNIGINSISGSFNSITANQYLVLVSTANTLTTLPANAVTYIPNTIIGNAKVVQQSATTFFTATALLPNTIYYFFVFSLNNISCINGPVFNPTNALANNATTLPLPTCASPVTQPTNLILNPSSSSIAGNFTASANADNYLVVLSTSITLSSNPVDNVDYAVGGGVGGGTVVANSNATSFIATGLMANTTYYIFVFASNKNCNGGTKYLTTAALAGNTTTLATALNNIYYGNLHAHSAYSDGNTDNLTYTPTQDFDYAKLSLCMDFLGISEHNHNTAGTVITNYHLGTAQSNAYSITNPGFLALYGMEWGTIGGGGHVVIYGDQMDELLGWETTAPGVTGSNYDAFVAKGDYIGTNGIFKNVNDRVAKNTFATLAHPNDTDYQNILGTYNAVADNAIVGVALENGPSTSANTSYSDPGSPMKYLPYYNTMLSRGYHIGPNMDHDNHKTTFGRTTKSRTAVIAPALTKTEIIKAMRNMHFYATQDCDAKVDFNINTKMMGTIFTDRNAPIISVNLTDPTNSTSTAVINIMFGIPGSNTLPSVIYSNNSNAINFTDNSLLNLTTGYYYADITYGAGRIITAPIWYTRNDAFVTPVTLSIFDVLKIKNSVKVFWRTEQELNSDYFIVQKSIDGKKWAEIGKINAAKNSTTALDYTFIDQNPNIGLNLYRLKQADKNSKIQYSTVKTVLFNSSDDILISPNPTTDNIKIYFGNNGKKVANIYLYAANGSLVKEINSNEPIVSINTSTFLKGLYFVKIIVENIVSTKKLLIQ